MNDIAVASVTLGRIIGIFLVICGLSLLVKRKDVMAMVENLRDNPAVLYLAPVTLIIGLVIVVIHPEWVMDWPVIITIIGWSLVLSSVVYLFFPQNAIVRLIDLFNRPASYVIDGVLFLVAGLYLVVMSFGLSG